MPTPLEIQKKLREYRGDPIFGIVKVELTDTVFGNSEIVYMARADWESLPQAVNRFGYTTRKALEFVFVVFEKHDPYQGRISTQWAETAYFEFKLIESIPYITA